MGGAQLASWVSAGGNTVLVSGPVGIGKSTECAHAAYSLRDERIACHVPVDRLTNIRRLTADELLQLIGGRLFQLAVGHLGFPADHPLSASFPAHTLATGRDSFRASTPTATRLLLDEVARWSRQGRVALVIDGLEKLPEGPTALEIFDALASLPFDVDLIVVVPWHAVYGRSSDVVLRAGERLFVIPPLETRGEAGVAAAQFFGAMLAHRVLNPPHELPADFQRLLGRAFIDSGGVPRTLLQIIADAATYARVNRGDAWPNDDDLELALGEQRDSLRRLLAPGDDLAIQQATGTDGRELERERKIRLLANGLLLERPTGQGARLDPHPLVPLAA